MISYPDKINEDKITALARSYNILDYYHQLKLKLSSILSEEQINQYDKFGLHKVYNELICNHYKGENTLKAKLTELFRQKKVTAAFEIRVNSSRIDFLTINGETRSFEIKSELDNLRKLSKQSTDYEQVFEYNYIVIDQKHLKDAQNIISDNYGIYILKDNQLTEYKKAIKNTTLNSVNQLNLFNSKELRKYFTKADGKIDSIYEFYDSEEINTIFKEMLKSRYCKNWNFLKSNYKVILPIDYQYFFYHNINPNIIYNN